MSRDQDELAFTRIEYRGSSLCAIFVRTGRIGRYIDMDKPAGQELAFNRASAEHRLAILRRHGLDTSQCEAALRGWPATARCAKATDQ